MADDSKMVFYRLDPADPSKRKKLGVLRLEDGEVKGEFFNDAFEYEVLSGMYDAKNRKRVGMDGGARFLELVRDKYGSSSFVAVEKS